jgi:hypothetical protein
VGWNNGTPIDAFDLNRIICMYMYIYIYNSHIGWNDGTPKEIYSPEELIDAFDLNRIIKSSAVFDMDKLRWINGQHLRSIPKSEIESLVGIHLFVYQYIICTYIHVYIIYTYTFELVDCI